jgi:hypothetical protein
MGLYAKMSKIMGEIEPIAKGGKNAHFGYKFVTADAVADIVRTLLAREGVSFFASAVNRELIQVEQIKKGEIVREPRWVVDYQFSFVDSETGEREDCTWSAEAPAADDKGLNKAATAAEKYFLMKTFVIATADELDTDREDGRGNRRVQQSSTNRNQPAKVAGSINPPQDLGELDWTAREGEDGVSVLVTDTVEVRMARTGKPFLTFSDGKQSAHSFTRDPLRPYMTEEQLAPLVEVGKYPLGGSYKVLFITKPGSDGKNRSEVVRIDKLEAQKESA